jgi:hypothetical protein
MSLADLVKADTAMILAEIGVPIEILFSGVVVRTVSGQFIEAVETISPGNINQVVYRPAFVVSAADFLGISKDNAVRILGNVYRLYGDPKPAAMLGMVQQLLVT